MHMISSAYALALQKPLRANRLHPRNMLIFVKRLALVRLVLNINLEMILKILPDTGQVDARLHSDRFELIRIPNARLEEQLRRVDRSRAQNHFARFDFNLFRRVFEMRNCHSSRGCSVEKNLLPDPEFVSFFL